MQEDIQNFIQSNSPDGGFLQSEEWRKFQQSVGRKAFLISADSFHASIIEHKLPIVGKYFYVPRGPIIKNQKSNLKNQNDNEKLKIFINNLIKLTKEKEAGWVRIEPSSPEVLAEIKKNAQYKIAKAPHDMQPRELFIIDITKPEEQLLSEMKSKTRYNIRLAEKRGVKTYSISNSHDSNVKYYFEEFVKLTKIMARRQGITAHPDEYYRKMLEIISGSILKLYLAEYNSNIVAANLVVFYGGVATYLHGASDDKYRNVMAPYLLQWRQVQDAKACGCKKYDFGGISKNYESNTNVRITNKWSGITRFKLGFSPNTKSIEFPGSYDIVMNWKRYWLYRTIQRIKSIKKWT